MPNSSGLQYYSSGGSVPFYRWQKGSSAFASTVLRCNVAVTGADCMITVCVPGRKPVNLIIDTAYNGARCIHAKLVQHFDEYYAFDDVEYSCEVETIVAPIEEPPRHHYAEEAQPAVRKERRVLVGWLDWLMNGHVVDVTVRSEE